MSTEVLAKSVCERHATMKRRRSVVDNVFQEIKDLVRPDTSDFTGSFTMPADSRRRVYDSTAIWSLDQLTSGLHSYLTNPVDRWFSFGVTGVPISRLSASAKSYLEICADIVFAHYAAPASAFNPSVHEVYMDLSAFGTGAIYQWMDMETMQLRFRSYPMADIWIDEDAGGKVDTVQRRVRWTIRQCKKEWAQLPEKMAKMGDDEWVQVIHEVRPRKDRDPNSYLSSNKAYSSCYVCIDTQELVSEGGYDWMPYAVPRWTTVAGELYGRGPTLSVLPEIRMVNAMSKTMIQAAQKMVDPPLMVEDDGYMLPVRTMPGGLNIRRPGAEPILPLPTAQRIDVGVDMIEQRREMIRRGYYVDWLIRPSKKERQTAEEIRDDRNQMLSMLAPVVGRQQGELCGPQVMLSFNLLNRHQMLPPMPAELQGMNLELVYISPAAKAQSTVRGQGLMAYLNQITQLLPIMPNILDSINADALNEELIDVTDVTRRVINTPEEVAANKAKREEQQQAAMAIEAGPAVGKTARDLASAKQMGMAIDI
jgi:hypothetical protein